MPNSPAAWAGAGVGAGEDGWEEAAGASASRRTRSGENSPADALTMWERDALEPMRAAACRACGAARGRT